MIRFYARYRLRKIYAQQAAASMALEAARQRHAPSRQIRAELHRLIAEELRWRDRA